MNIVTPKYPDIEVNITECNGIALAIVARTCRIMKRLGVPRHAIRQYRNESFAGTHDELVATASRWVVTT